eukprot:TRINITY_DN22225_c0_g1_i1.p1 TRINITY_DN22225_c0_g1~~TRINITY_DN22225_c0_g1_i1.p1  ORF type:complete len:407 (+),score=45.87 TRINITY_DN22225_c0_g1_i1:39-1259(+)
MDHPHCLGRRHYPGLHSSERVWPFMDEKPARVMENVDDFVNFLMYGDHMNTITVLTDGIRKLGQQNGLPEDLVKGLQKSRRVRELFDRCPNSFLETTKGRVWQYNEAGRETEIKSADKLDSLTEIREALLSEEEAGKYNRDVPIYISELRNSKKKQHPITGEMVKTATQIDVRDVVSQATLAPFWERGEGGIFIGERGAGSGLHVDQCLWSNIGKQWYGYKLVALWPWEERINILEDAKRGSIFHFPLTQENIEHLSRAAVVALIKPGDVFVFSGAIPHMAMCIGDEINVTAYESFLPLNVNAITTLSLTNSKDHFKRCWMDDDDLDEIFEDIVDSIAGNLQDSRVDPDTLRDLKRCEEVMIEYGDSYCRRLWNREHARRKRAADRPLIQRHAGLTLPTKRHKSRV